MKLGDICSVQSGGTPKRSKAEYWVNGNIPWVKISDIKGQFLSETEEKITEEGLANSSAKVFQKGTILYTIFATLGEVCILNIEAATNQAIAGLSIKTKELCPEYLYYFLCAQKEQINKVGRGVAQNNINLTILRDIEINLPTRPEQKRIAVILEQNDKLINLRKKQLQELDNIIKSRFIEMFGDPVKNTMRWEVVTFSEIFRMIKSGLSRKLSDDDIGLPMIRSKNIVKGVLDLSDLKYWHINDPQGADTNEYILDDGDILVNFINSSSQIGKGCIFHDIGRPCIYTTNCFRIKLKSDCNEIYFNSYMMTEGYYRQIQSIIQPAVNQASFTTKNYLQLKIPLPPLSLQNQFADFVAQVDKSKFACALTMHFYQTLQNSLRQEWMRCQTLNF